MTKTPSIRVKRKTRATLGCSTASSGRLSGARELHRGNDRAKPGTVHEGYFFKVEITRPGPEASGKARSGTAVRIELDELDRDKRIDPRFRHANDKRIPNLSAGKVHRFPHPDPGIQR